ncbi:MAG: hypothetical protein ACOCYN_04360 [Planctomycetota bacterium]
MFAAAAYALATLAMLAQLVHSDHPSTGLYAVATAGLALGVWTLYARLPRWLVGLLAVAISGLVVLVMSITVQFSPGQALIVTALAMVYVGLALADRLQLTIAVLSVLPLAATAELLRGAPTREILAWSLLSWSLLPLLMHGRPALLGGGLMWCVASVLVFGPGAAPVSLRPPTLDDLSNAGPALLLGLSLIHLVPAVLRAQRSFLWPVGAGLLLAVLLTLLALATGPWPGGRPLVLDIAMQAALTLAGVGVLGLLCTVRQGWLLWVSAERILGFAVVATVVALLVPAGAGQAVSVLVGGAAVSLLLLLAGRIAGGQAQPGTASLPQVEPLTVPGDRPVSEVWRTVRTQVSEVVVDARRRGLRTSHLVPLALLCLTYPTWPHLTTGWVLPLLVALMAPVAGGMLAHSMSAALLVPASLALATWALGAPPLLALSCGAGGLALLYPFVRCDDLGGLWILPTGFVALAVLHPFYGGVGDAWSETVMAAGVAVLAANLLGRGSARWPVLAAAALGTCVYLAWWIPRKDPFAVHILFDHDHLLLGLRSLTRIPVVALALQAVWVVRVHEAAGRRFEAVTLGWSAIALGATVYAVFGMPWLVLVAPVAWVALLPLLFAGLREVDFGRAGGWRAPLADGSAWLLAVLLAGLGRAYLIAVAAGGSGGVPKPVRAGAMGEVMLGSICTAHAALLGLVMVAAAGPWVRHRRRLTAALVRRCRALMPRRKRRIAPRRADAG